MKLYHSSKMKSGIFYLSFISYCLGVAGYSYAEDYFDPKLLSLQSGMDPNSIDLSQFEKANSVPEGKYNITVFINKRDMGSMDVTFVKGRDGDVSAEFTKPMLGELGVNLASLPTLQKLTDDEKMTALGDYIPEAFVKTNLSKLTMEISIPQIYMDNRANGYVPEGMLENGIPAILLSYQLNGSHSRNQSQRETQNNDNAFLSMRGGVNLGAWRLRSNYRYYYSNSEGRRNYTNRTSTFSNTYVMRAINALRGEILVGESSTGSNVFDSIPFKGIKLFSNEKMLPSSMRGFAPEINGIAQSNARITVSQNGNVVYQTYVAPGPFSIKDLYPTGSSGNLQVNISEEDGSERTFVYPYSSLPVMLRPGGMKYEVTAGEYNGNLTRSSKRAKFLLSSLVYGLPHDVTLYGGSLFSKDYFSGVMGTGISLGNFGALSVDITHAAASFVSGDRKEGQSFRIKYSKSLTSTGTNVDLTALRYSTRHFFSFSDFNTHNYQLNDGVAPWLGLRQRSSFRTALSQSLGKYGSIYLSGSRTDYWDSNTETTQLSTGYNGNFKGVNYNVSYAIDYRKSDSRNDWPKNHQISFNVNVPFSLFTNEEHLRNMSSNYYISKNNRGNYSQQVGLHGSLLDRDLSYSVSQSMGNNNQESNSAISLNYNTSKGSFSGGYNYSSSSSSVNAGVNGGMVIHSGGLTLARTLGNSVVLVEAPDADGTSLNQGNAKIDMFGYAVAPNVNEYAKNTIGLNVNTLPDDVTLPKTSQNVYPTKGAVVKAKFPTRVGMQALISLTYRDGVIPFGAIAKLVDGDANEENTSIVGDNGQLYMSGLPDSGTLLIQWGNSHSASCGAHYSHLKDIAVTEDNPIRKINLTCQ